MPNVANNCFRAEVYEQVEVQQVKCRAGAYIFCTSINYSQSIYLLALIAV